MTQALINRYSDILKELKVRMKTLPVNDLKELNMIDKQIIELKRQRADKNLIKAWKMYRKQRTK